MGVERDSPAVSEMHHRAQQEVIPACDHQTFQLLPQSDQHSEGGVTHGVLESTDWPLAAPITSLLIYHLYFQLRTTDLTSQYFSAIIQLLQYIILYISITILIYAILAFNTVIYPISQHSYLLCCYSSNSNNFSMLIHTHISTVEWEQL